MPQSELSIVYRNPRRRKMLKCSATSERWTPSGESSNTPTLSANSLGLSDQFLKDLQKLAATRPGAVRAMELFVTRALQRGEAADEAARQASRQDLEDPSWGWRSRTP
jgi:hypothetical protein